jgi:hypothetical protein
MKGGYRREMTGSGAVGPGSIQEFYDADEQKYLNLEKLDRILLLWLTVKKIGDLMSEDPEEKGKYHVVIIGGGMNAITEKRYVDHPHNRLWGAVRYLHALLTPERGEDETYGTDYKKIMDKFASKPKYDYQRSEALFRRLVRLIEDNYGREEKIIDRI